MYSPTSYLPLQQQPLTPVYLSSQSPTVSPTIAVVKTPPSSPPIDTLSTTLLGDIGLASLVGAFAIPVVGAVAGILTPVTLGVETALGTSGAGLSFLYPQAFESISTTAKSIPPWIIALIVIGGGVAIIGGAYYGNRYIKKRKRNVK